MSPSAAIAGETIAVSGPPGSFGAGKNAEIRMVQVRTADDAVILATVESRADGKVETKATVPADTETGVYLVFIEGADAAGATRVLTAPLAVSAKQGAAPPADPPAKGAVPPAVSTIKPKFAPSEDAGVVGDVAAGRSRLVIDGKILDAVDLEAGENGTGTTGKDSDGVPWWGWAAFAVGAALFGGALAARGRRARTT